MTNFRIITNDSQMKILAQTADLIWHEYFAFLLAPEQIDYMVERFQSYDALKTQIAQGYEYYFIEKDGEIIGYSGFCFKDNELFLSKLYILKDYRNFGFGREALNFLIKKALEKKLPQIMLTVNKYNESTIKAYKKWGFVVVDSVVTDIGEGFVMDDYIMALNVK